MSLILHDKVHLKPLVHQRLSIKSIAISLCSRKSKGTLQCAHVHICQKESAARDGVHAIAVKAFQLQANMLEHDATYPSTIRLGAGGKSAWLAYSQIKAITMEACNIASTFNIVTLIVEAQALGNLHNNTRRGALPHFSVGQSCKGERPSGTSVHNLCHTMQACVLLWNDSDL
jgi:hypothetical protein